MGVHPVATQLEQHQSIIAGRRKGGHGREKSAEVQRAMRTFYAEYVAAHGTHGAITATMREFKASRPTVKKYVPK
jgi:hypothetical protein